MFEKNRNNSASLGSQLLCWGNLLWNWDPDHSFGFKGIPAMAVDLPERCDASGCFRSNGFWTDGFLSKVALLCSFILGYTGWSINVLLETHLIGGFPIINGQRSGAYILWWCSECLCSACPGGITIYRQTHTIQHVQMLTAKSQQNQHWMYDAISDLPTSDVTVGVQMLFNSILNGSCWFYFRFLLGIWTEMLNKYCTLSRLLLYQPICVTILHIHKNN